MQYNKQQFNKVNDKKIMKKVKKQWVVVSVASLAVLGGFAVSGTLSLNHPANAIVAHADDKSDGSGDGARDGQNDGANASTAGSYQFKDSTKSQDYKTAYETAYKNAFGKAFQQKQNNGQDSTNGGRDGSRDGQSDARIDSQNNGAVRQYHFKDNGQSDAYKSAYESNYKTAYDNNFKPTSSTQSNDSIQGTKDGQKDGSASGAKQNGYNYGSHSSTDDYGKAYKVAYDKAYNTTAGSMDAWNAIHNDDQKHTGGNASTSGNTSGSNAGSGASTTTQSGSNGGSSQTSQASSSDASSQTNGVQPNNSATIAPQGDNNNPYYQASYQGTVEAWKKYKDLTDNSGGTQNVKDYSGRSKEKGVDPNNPNSVDKSLNDGSSFSTNANADKAQIPNDPNATKNGSNESSQVSGSNGQSSVTTTQNSAANTPGNSQIAGGTISGSTNSVSTSSVNNYNNQVKLNDYKPDLNDDSIKAAYNQGITNFLKYQGAYDAETGRWSGKSKNDAINLDPNSTNAYDQSYRGAQDAIYQNFKSDNTLNYATQNDPTSLNVSTLSGRSNYNDAFNDAVNKMKSGVVFAQSAIQFYNGLYPNVGVTNNANVTTRDTYDFDNKIKSVRLIQDINFQDTALRSTDGTTERNSYIDPTVANANLTIDGQNHMADFGSALFSMRDTNASGASGTDVLNVQNFKTMYGSNFYGPTKLENTGRINYANITYIGSEFVNAKSSASYISGNLNIFSVGNYNSPFAQNVKTEDSSGQSYDGKNSPYGDRQQNMEVNDLTMNPGSNYYGSSTGGDIIEVGLNGTGSFNMSNNSHMTLAPMNSSQSAENSPDSNAVGLYIASGSSVNVPKGASVEINPVYNSYTTKGLAQGIYINGGTMNINGGSFVINENGNLTNTSSNANYDGGKINVSEDGSFQINANNMNGSTNGTNYLLNVGDLVNIQNRGNFGIHTDGSGNPNSTLYLLYNAAPINIDNPGQRVYLQIDNNNGKSGIGNLFLNQINAQSVRYSLNYKKDSTNNTPNDPQGVYYALRVPATSGSNLQYYYVDKNNSANNKWVSIDNASAYGAKYLSFDATPNAYFDKDISLQAQSNGSRTLSGSVKLSNLPSNDIFSPLNNGDNGYLNLDASYDNSSNKEALESDYTGKNNGLDGSALQSVFLIKSDGSKEQLTYYDDTNGHANIVKIPKDAQNGEDVQFVYSIPRGTNKNPNPQSNVTTKVGYFVTSQSQTLTSAGTATSDNGLNDLYSNNPEYGQQKINENNKTGINFKDIKFQPTEASAISDGERDGIADAANSSKDDPTNTYAYKDYYANDQYGDDYIKSYNNANAGYKKGSSDLSSGKYNYQDSSNNDPSTNDSINNDIAQKQYKDGYAQANQDLQDGFKDKTLNDKSNKSDNTLYQKGQDYATGVQNAVNGTQNSGSNSSDVDQGKNDFNAGYEGNNNPDSIKNNNPAYNYGTQMANGMKDAENKDIHGNPSSAHQPSDTNGTDYQAYQNGKDAYNGRNDALNGINEQGSKSDSYSKNYDATSAGLAKHSNAYSGNAPQNDSYNIGAATRDGISNYQKNGVKDTNDHNGNYNGTSNEQTNTAYKNAQNDFADGKSHPNDTSSGHDVAYQAGQAAQNGLNDAANGNNNQSKYGNDTIPSNTYQTAQKAYQAGLNSNSNTGNSDTDNPSYQAGVAAKQAMADAFSGKTYNSNPSGITDRNTYQTAYNAAKDGMNGQLASTSDKSQMNAYNNGKAIQAAMQAASQDLNSKINAYSEPFSINHDSNYYQNAKNILKIDPSSDGLTDTQKSQLQNYKDAYTAYYRGSNSDNSPSPEIPSVSDNVDTTQNVAYQSGKTAGAVNAGIKDAKSGDKSDKNGNPNNYNGYTDGINKPAYENAYKAYRSGFNQQSNQDAVSSNQGYAYNLGKAAQAGVQSVDSTNGSGNNQNGTSISHDNPYPYGSIESNEFTSAENAANVGDYNKGTSINALKSEDNRSKANNNILAYQAGQTLQATRDGIVDAAGNAENRGKNGSYYTSGNNDTKGQQNQAYSNAYQAYNNGYNNAPSASSSDYKNYDSGQADAYNQGRAAQAAVQDASKGTFSNNSDNAPTPSDNPTSSMNSSANSNYNNSSYKPSGSDWTAAQTNVYKQAYQAYLDGKHNPTKTATDAQSTFGKLQNKAYKDGQKDGIVPTAIMDAINGKDNSIDYGSTSSYKDAQNNFNKDLNGSSSDDSQESNAAIAVKQAMNDASKNIGSADSPFATYNYNNDQKAEYTAAYNAYKAGAAKNSSNDSALNQTSPINSIPYKNGLAAYDGVSNRRTGNTYDDSSNPYYTNAQKAYNAGLNGDTTSSDAKLNADANNAGKADRQGISDAIDGKTNTENTDANTAAADGLKASTIDHNNYNAPTPTSDSDKKNIPAYQAGWAAAKGISDMQNGGKDNSDKLNNYPSQKAAYQQAQRNYNAGKADMNKTSADINGSTAYQAGQKDQAAQNGITDAINNVSNKGADNKNYPTNNKNGQQDAYNAANNGYQVGVNKPAGTNLDKVPENQKDPSQYTAGYNAGQAAKQGIVDKESDSKSNSYPDSQQQAAYNKAKDDYDDGMDNPMKDKVDSTKSIAYQQGQRDRKGINDALIGNGSTNGNPDSYNAAKAGLNARKDSNTPDGYKSQQTAYNIGKATSQAITDASNGDVDQNGANKFNDPNEVKTYNQAKQDFQDGLSNKQNKSGKDTPFNTSSAAYNAGQAARTGYKDAENNKNDVSSQGNDFNQNAYANAQKAYNAGLSGNSTIGNAKLNQPANQAGLDAKQAITDAIANNDGNYSNGSDDYKAAYNAAKAGRTGQKLPSQDASHPDNGYGQTAAYDAGKAAYDGYKNAENGTSTLPNSDTKVPDSPSAQINNSIYTNAQNAYKAGLKGDSTSDTAKADKTANQAGIDSRDGINDVIAAGPNAPKPNTAKSYDYKAAYNAAKAGNTGKQMPSTAPAPNGESLPQNTAYQAGQAAQQGITDAQVNKNDPGQYSNNTAAQSAYNNAQQAYSDGMAGKTDTPAAKANPEANKVGQANTDGINDAINGNSSSLNKYNGSDQTNNTARDVYNKAKNAYNAGSTGDTSSDAAKGNYYGNQAGYNSYVNSQSNGGSSDGSQNFINGGNGTLNGNSYYNSGYSDGYTQAQSGFTDGMNGNPNSQPTNGAYNKGYQAAKDYAQGMSDASHGKANASNGNYAYNIGYNAYQAGANGKPYQPNYAMNQSYQDAAKKSYDAGRAKYLEEHGNKPGKDNGHKNNNLSKAERAGRAHAATGSVSGLFGRSKAYKDAYMKAFNDYVKRNLPRYVYNLKKIYSHDAAALTRQTRVKKYAKTPRYARHAFRVLGYKITSSGHVVYKVKGLGWISASDKSVDNLYYRRHDTKKPIHKIRVIKPQGTYIYNSKTFNKKTAVKKMKSGSIVNVERIEKVGGITRFYIGDGKYISSNKTIVEHVR
ncbi:hypothetical protein DY037_00080 [Apilactobacillus micheneri]|uniref:DUF5776 domain-containing protein n=1 Tax=Apilactobacillus micheneri TaxID=1899430 RepID=UPI00112CB7B4|nr:DUF5776 domain-containing protein [Apilactobacillus micheneri]TPR50385.1 hypothetical protein DY037_00080 [Apilactobacillus micheneri]